MFHQDHPHGVWKVLLLEDLFRERQVDKTIQITFGTGRSTEAAVKTQILCLDQRVADPGFLVVTEEGFGGGLGFTGQHVAPRNRVKDIALRRDKPIATVDLFQVKEPGLLTFDACPAAVLVELGITTG
ncbi:MAG: hypothetical protein O7C75_17655 [Verrucomicrobia bacterium]|nr:hypothetical protein [Verrucomicrobiota bacterium]